MAPSHAPSFTTVSPLLTGGTTPNRALLVRCGGAPDTRPGGGLQKGRSDEWGDYSSRPVTVIAAVVRDSSRDETDLLEAVTARRAAALECLGGVVRTAVVAPVARTVVGLKSPSSLLDNGITLHPIYGWPYLPGHALKGVARAWLDEHESLPSFVDSEGCEDGDSTSEASAVDWSLGWDEVFGSEVGEEPVGGEATFYDAHPSGDFSLTVDTITPHSPDLTLNPIPVPFFADQGTRMTLAVGSRHPELADFMVEALDYVGVGGKTSSGYGYYYLAEEGAL